MKLQSTQDEHFGTREDRHLETTGVNCTVSIIYAMDTSALVSGQFGTIVWVPKCLGAEVSRCRSVRTQSLEYPVYVHKIVYAFAAAFVVVYMSVILL